MNYQEYLDAKAQSAMGDGIPVTFMPDCLFGFQKHLVEWTLRIGRGAEFADCGLGKTLMQLVWSQNVAKHTGKPVLVCTPLAVGPQTVREAERFGIEAARCQDGTSTKGRIIVTNYERVERFTPGEFGGVVCDESSILKSFDGATRKLMTDFMHKVPYRLLATATAAPNDYVELGTSSEALGHLGHMDMLNRFFRNDNNNSATGRQYGEAVKWRFKGHAELAFWRWVTSWARACRRPSDLGFPDDAFILPEISTREHCVTPGRPRDGYLFVTPAKDLREQREDVRHTMQERCEMVAKLVDHDQPAVVWCHLNDEGDLLERLIPGAVQVSGKDSDEKKEEALCGFSKGNFRVLITKPKIGAWGLNWQHCAHICYFPSHSYESYYQAVRRCWRFGQQRPVQVDLVMTDGERLIMQNLSRKSVQADEMFSRLVAEMNHAVTISGRREYNQKEEMPAWL